MQNGQGDFNVERISLASARRHRGKTEHSGDRREAPLSPVSPFSRLFHRKTHLLACFGEAAAFRNEKMNPSWREDHVCVQTHTPGEMETKRGELGQVTCLNVQLAVPPPSLHELFPREIFKGNKFQGILSLTLPLTSDAGMNS